MVVSPLDFGQEGPCWLQLLVDLEANCYFKMSILSRAAS